MHIYLPIFLLALMVLGFVVINLGVTHLLGPKVKNSVKAEVFECGIASVDNARLPFSVKQFLIAILFVLFDVEIVFMYPWAVNFKQLGWVGFSEVVLFVGLVGIGLFYVIDRGVLEINHD